MGIACCAGRKELNFAGDEKTYSNHLGDIKKMLYEGEFTESIIKDNDISFYGWRSHHLDDSDKTPFIINIFKKSRQAILLKFELVTVDKNAAEFVYDEVSKKKFYEVLFESVNSKIVEKIILDSEKIADFKPLVNPAILNYLKDKKIEVANLGKLIIAEEPKEEKLQATTKPAETKDDAAQKAEKK